MKRWLTTSNVLATIAVLAAFAGTTITAAYAAHKGPFNLTGKNVKDGTLTSVDFRDLGIATTAFNPTARTLFKSMKGPQGDPGAVGASGAAGSKGATGVKGPSAARAYSYITAADTTSFIRPTSGTMINGPGMPGATCGGSLSGPNGPGTCNPTAPYYPHWAYMCTPTAAFYCNLGTNIGASGAGVTPLVRQAQGVVGFTGDENGSFVSLMGPGNVVVTSSIVLMHRPTDWHTRVSCQPQVRRSNTSDPYVGLGVPTVVSSSGDNELVHINVTGATYLSTAGDYDYQVACRLLDESNANSQFEDWYFISGNATATTTEL